MKSEHMSCKEIADKNVTISRLEIELERSVKEKNKVEQTMSNNTKAIEQKCRKAYEKQQHEMMASLKEAARRSEQEKAFYQEENKRIMLQFAIKD